MVLYGGASNPLMLNTNSEVNKMKFTNLTTVQLRQAQCKLNSQKSYICNWQKCWLQY